MASLYLFDCIATSWKIKEPIEAEPSNGPAFLKPFL
jgi:hypothetical protein